MSSRLALLIGSNRYEDDRLQFLEAPPHDVYAFSEVLQDPEIGQFDEVKCFINETRDTICEAIEDIFADRMKDDLVLLYFSGHGLLDAFGRLFFAVPRTRFDRLSSTGIAADAVKDWMDHSSSRRQILILDCCHSGAFKGNARSSLEQRALTQKTFGAQGHGRLVLTATDATSYAFDGDSRRGDVSENNLGVFTRYIVEGLRTGEAAPESDTISAQQLFDFARERVRADDARMKPQFWADESEGQLILARNPDPVGLIPDEIHAHLSSSDHIVRQGAVAELVDRAKSDEGLTAAVIRTLEKHASQERDYAVRSSIRESLNSLTSNSITESRNKNPNNSTKYIDFRICIIFIALAFYIIGFNFGLYLYAYITTLFTSGIYLFFYGKNQSTFREKFVGILFLFASLFEVIGLVLKHPPLADELMIIHLLSGIIWIIMPVVFLFRVWRRGRRTFN